jgi:hypothetical protein
MPARRKFTRAVINKAGKKTAGELQEFIRQARILKVQDSSHRQYMSKVEPIIEIAEQRGAWFPTVKDYAAVYHEEGLEAGGIKGIKSAFVHVLKVLYDTELTHRKTGSGL